MKSLWIGIDGGASRSRAILVDQENALLAEAEGSGLNPLAVGWDQFGHNVQGLLNELVSGYPTAQVAGLCAGLAGVGAEAIRLRAQKVIAALLPDAKVRVITDAQAALWGAFGGEPGLLLIAGTGSICWGMNARGQTARSGGFGRLLGDEGGGYWMAVEAIRFCLQARDKGRPHSLTSFICREFGLRDVSDIVPLIYDSKTTPELVAGLAQIIISNSKQNKNAQCLVRAAAQHLTDLVDNTRRKLKLRKCRIALWGGLWNSAGREMQIALQREFDQRHFLGEIVPPRRPPEWGALLYLRSQPA